MAVGDFDTYYPDNPWDSVTTNQRAPWYFPTLYRVFRRTTVFNNFVKQEFNFNGPRSTELVVTSLLDPHVNHSPIGARQMWLTSARQDSFNRRIAFQRYGNKMSYNRYDDLITFWELDNVRGLNKIINDGFGQMITRTLDKLARDAYIRSPFVQYKPDGSGTGWNSIATTDTAKAEYLQDMRLGLKERDNPVAVDPTGGLGDTIICITSPGVLRDLRFEAATAGNSAAFLSVNQYTSEGRKAILTGEIGMYHGVRFIEHPDAVLWNCGTIIAQTTITAPIAAGDGSPDPSSTAADGIEYVGQPGAAHSIAVTATTSMNVGDVVTVHVMRSSAKGVTNGVDHTDGKLQNRRIVAKTGTTLTFERPIMEDFATDLGAGVYGYVTKGRNIHMQLFLFGNDGVARGVAQPPTIHTPRPVDDLDMIQRITFDAYLGYTPFNKNAFEIVFLAGSNRMVGPRFIQ